MTLLTRCTQIKLAHVSGEHIMLTRIPHIIIGKRESRSRFVDFCVPLHLPLRRREVSDAYSSFCSCHPGIVHSIGIVAIIVRVSERAAVIVLVVVHV